MEPSDDYKARQRTNLLVFAIAVLIVVGTVTLMLMLRHGIRQEDCFAAGHRNCAPVETH